MLEPYTLQMFKGMTLFQFHLVTDTKDKLVAAQTITEPFIENLQRPFDSEQAARSRESHLRVYWQVVFWQRYWVVTGRQRTPTIMVYGFKLHALVNVQGLFKRWSFAAAHHHEAALVPKLIEAMTELIIGDKAYLGYEQITTHNRKNMTGPSC